MGIDANARGAHRQQAAGVGNQNVMGCGGLTSPGAAKIQWLGLDRDYNSSNPGVPADILRDCRMARDFEFVPLHLVRSVPSIRTSRVSPSRCGECKSPSS